MRLINKVALITGATSGMGRATAVLFAREGAKVVLVGRRAPLGQEVVNSIRMEGGEAIFVHGDVSKSCDAEQAVRRAVEEYGGLNVLFNNAGINQSVKTSPHEEPEKDWDQIIDVNLKGTFLFTKYAVPEMRNAGGGSIINNSSVLDNQAADSSSSAYHASKGGVGALTRQSAVVYAQDRIRVNCIQPGSIATEMSEVPWDSLDDPGIVARFQLYQPLPIMGHPRHVASAALFFASDESEFITGTSLLVDGGMSAKYDSGIS